MKKKFILFIPCMTIYLLYLVFVIASTLDNDPVYQFLADWDCYMLIVELSFKFAELDERFCGKWWWR